MKRVICVFITLVLLVMTAAPALAHDGNKHNEDLEYVLFYDRWYSKSHTVAIKETIECIEKAAYLAIDQFNSEGKEELENLLANKIPGIPKSIEEINFSSNYAHREFTHRGWNMDYDKEVKGDQAHWPKRQDILKNTIRAKLFSKVESPIYGNGNARQCEAFAVLVYYVHILGDHIAADKHKDLAYVAPLSNSHDRDNPGIIPDLIRYMPMLFESQTDSRQYQSFIQELKSLEDTADRLYTGIGGVKEEQFPDYHQCALKLLETLATYIPELLKKEQFFHSTFYE